MEVIYTTNNKQLIFDRNNSLPVWSPDGKHIAYS